MSLRSRQESSGFSVMGVGQDLLRIGGGGSPLGASYFMVRVLVSGTLSSACLGLAGAGLIATLLGTGALPFLLCSCAGFVFGAIGFYRSTVVQSLAMLERHPRLMQLHLDANFPSRGYMRWRREDLRPERFRGSWRMESVLMTALLTAQPAIDRIYDERESVLVEEARAELAAAAASEDHLIADG
ncbi:hypothetical protein LTR29_009012 [Friedmanniomyces endolithicus]|nr:hypothetical protein LTR29_009012 [Friedmanniomyces endolithicus]